MRKDIQDYCIAALKLKDDRKPLAREFLAGLRARARQEWWPCLTRLQVAHYRAKKSKLHAMLLERWTEFGSALDLEEERERKRHRKEQRVFCSWPSCEFNTKEPPSKVLLCQGCGEVQYCGKDCQRMYVFLIRLCPTVVLILSLRRDWNRGGHKQKCGTRIKG